VRSEGIKAAAVPFTLGGVRLLLLARCVLLVLGHAKDFICCTYESTPFITATNVWDGAAKSVIMRNANKRLLSCESTTSQSVGVRE